MSTLTARSKFDLSPNNTRNSSQHKNGALKTRGQKAADQLAHGCGRLHTQATFTYLCLCIHFRHVRYTYGYCSRGIEKTRVLCVMEKKSTLIFFFYITYSRYLVVGDLTELQLFLMPYFKIKWVRQHFGQKKPDNHVDFSEEYINLDAVKRSKN